MRASAFFVFCYWMCRGQPKQPSFGIETRFREGADHAFSPPALQKRFFPNDTPAAPSALGGFLPHILNEVSGLAVQQFTDFVKGSP